MDFLENSPKYNKAGNGYPNLCIAPWVLDAIFIAEVTGDSSMEKIASASLNWITGLNPGVPVEFVMNPYNKQSRKKTRTSAALS